MGRLLYRPWTFFLSVCLLPAFVDTVYAMLEDQFLYFPDREITLTPASAGLAYEDVSFPAEDGTLLHGWYVPGAEGAPLMLFFHGNAGNISDRVDHLDVFHRIGLAVFLFDYRGYGRSEGTPTEQGTYADARGALAWARAQGYTPGRLVYYGHSLGSGIAVQLASETPPGGLVLESPFTSLREMGRLHYPILYPLLGWALRARYDNLDKIPSIRVPLLVVQGERDSIVPASMARSLFEAAREPKRFLLIPGAGHNDVHRVGNEDYGRAWKSFLREAFPP